MSNKENIQIDSNKKFVEEDLLDANFLPADHLLL